MRVLVACEFSGVVRASFAARGHDAWSCDLRPALVPGPHIQGDVLRVLGDGWDLMIAHPPCTHLAVSGARWFARKRRLQKEALEFFRKLLEAPIPRIAIENPVSIVSTRIRRPDQIVHPWQFGHPESKRICLWLKNLPRLFPTKVVPPPLFGCRCGRRYAAARGEAGCPRCRGRHGRARPIYLNQTASGQNRLGPSPVRSELRSIMYPGVAQAMAEQWG